MNYFEVDEFTFETLLTVLEKGNAMQNDIEEYLRPFNISHGRFSILLTLYKHLNDWVHPSYLADALNKRRPTITGMIKKLAADGFITEKDDEVDGRKKVIKLNENGYSLLSKIIPDYNKRIIQIGRYLTDDEKHMLIKLVRKIQI